MIGQITVGELVAWLLAIAAAIVALEKAWTVIATHKTKRTPPCAERLKMLDNDKKHLEKIDQVLDRQAESNGVMFRALAALINHQLSGNDVEVLRKARDEIQDFLTRKDE